MNYDLHIGARVHCKEQLCGRLAKIVVEPKTQQVTELVVEKGLLLKRQRVVPFGAVTRADGNDLYLDLSEAEFSACPDYAEGDVFGKVFGIRPPETGCDQGLKVRMPATLVSSTRRSPHGKRERRSVIGSDTPVSNLTGTIGHIASIVVDERRDGIAQLIVNRGLFAEPVAVPMEYIESVSDGEVFVSATSNELRVRSRHRQQSDEELLAELHESLHSKWPVFNGVDVSVQRGVVLLSGRVRSEALKQHAAELAQLVDGVVSVQNDVVVHPEFTIRIKTPEMVDIATKVSTALAQDPRTKRAYIDVIGDRNVVILQGHVDSVETRRVAEMIAGQQPNVRSVDNALVVAN